MGAGLTKVGVYLFSISFIVLLLVSARAAPAYADCSNPTGQEGDIVYNADQNVPQVCNGSAWMTMGALNPAAGGSGCATVGLGVKPEGYIFYNLDHHVLQYCDGDDWRAASGNTASSGLSGPAGCVNIGDLCADGTVFAGYHPITQEHLYIPTTDQGTTSQWKTSTGSNDIATDSTYDGRANSNQVANSTTFPAFKLCKDLTTGGHTDWYLPSQVELFYVWAVHPTIEAGGNITNFQNADYWSSMERSTTNAWTTDLGSGYQDYSPKTDAYRVRCIRR